MKKADSYSGLNAVRSKINKKVYYAEQRQYYLSYDRIRTNHKSYLIQKSGNKEQPKPIPY